MGEGRASQLWVECWWVHRCGTGFAAYEALGRRQRVRIVAALFRLLALECRAHHRPGGVVELQISAAGVVESADRLFVGRRHIGEIGVEIRIDVPGDRLPALAEMHGAGRRDAHFRDDTRLRLKEAEMVDLRMT